MNTIDNILQSIEPFAAAECARLGCMQWGVAAKAAKQWANDAPIVWCGAPLPALPVAHDERKAPYFALPANSDSAYVPIGANPCANEAAGLLCSFTDEEGIALCVWAQPTPGSTLVGLGADLAIAEDFAEDEHGNHFARLLFTESERALAPTLAPGNVPLARACLFSAKEAAFKATAAPLRTWYRTHTRELRFEVRDFCMRAPGQMTGIARKGAAQAACDAMGIAISVAHLPLSGAVLTLAFANYEHN